MALGWTSKAAERGKLDGAKTSKVQLVFQLQLGYQHLQACNAVVVGVWWSEQPQKASFEPTNYPPSVEVICMAVSTDKDTASMSITCRLSWIGRLS